MKFGHHLQHTSYALTMCCMNIFTANPPFYFFSSFLVHLFGLVRQTFSDQPRDFTRTRSRDGSPNMVQKGKNSWLSGE